MTITAKQLKERAQYAAGKVNLWDICHNLRIKPFQREYVGIPGRRFRFDFADPDAMLAIEYEGTAGNAKSRHLTMGGYAKDCEKYSLAALHGWTVIRFTILHTQEQVERWVTMHYTRTPE